LEVFQVIYRLFLSNGKFVHERLLPNTSNFIHFRRKMKLSENFRGILNILIPAQSLPIKFFS
jgi:hypothetical protein